MEHQPSNLLHAAEVIHWIALAVMAVVYTLRLRWLFGFKAAKDKSAPGNPTQSTAEGGARYSLMNVFMPWGMESTRKNFGFYLTFVLFHLGVVAPWLADLPRAGLAGHRLFDDRPRPDGQYPALHRNNRRGRPRGPGPAGRPPRPRRRAVAGSRAGRSCPRRRRRTWTAGRRLPAASPRSRPARARAAAARPRRRARRRPRAQCAPCASGPRAGRGRRPAAAGRWSPRAGWPPAWWGGWSRSPAGTRGSSS